MRGWGDEPRTAEERDREMREAGVYLVLIIVLIVTMVVA